MKKIVFASLFTLYSCITLASHITGGEMLYQYLGTGSQPNTKKYNIILKLFRDQHTTGAAMPTSVYIGLFNNDNNTQFPAYEQYYTVALTAEETVRINPYPPCVRNATELDYHVGYFSFTLELPDNTGGYTASYQTCCRVNPLNNVYTDLGTGGTGSTYTCVIPGIADTSPAFASSIDLICQNREFTLNFKAEDADGDSLVYSFSEAYDGGLARNASNLNPAPPPYVPVEYISGFSGLTPLGTATAINPLTGVISGTAPPAGKYVVSVQVASYKGRKLLGVHRKDFIVNVGDCDVPGAELDPKPVTCSGYSVAFSNDNPSVLNKTVFWDFGDPGSGAADTSTETAPVHQFSDTGVFVYKLIVNKDQACSDSTTQTIKIYPGFFPGFTSMGQCKNTNINFNDTTKSTYGHVNRWSWNFGDLQRTNDSSHVKTPSYVFTVSDSYTVRLIVGDDKGCIDSATVTLPITDKPEISITNDTLICAIDTLQLQAIGAGTFFWTPAYNINNQNISSPLVSPDVPTKYYANILDAYGCKGVDSIFVDVKNAVTLDAGRDTIICKTDNLVLKPVSDGLYFKWTPANSLNGDSLKNPVATPLSNTLYSVTAAIGKCKSTDAIMVKVAPYPTAYAGIDTAICLGHNIRLIASGGSHYLWTPPFFLDNPTLADPLANPVHDINYIVTVSDTLGCPKTVNDSVLIRVFDVVAEAGPRDTSVVVNQPLILKASGGESYTWSPATGLSNAHVSNPTAVLNNSRQFVLTVTQSGCFDTDTINITVYKVEAGIYVPNAFTPNNDGANDVFRPIALGMKSITSFRVYNRWGKLIFSTAKSGSGWDGKFEGRPLDPDVYVWLVEGIDYVDKKVARKGSVVLIR